MSEKKLQCSRYIENFNPPYLIEKLVNKICESVADAFLGQIEYGKDYVVGTDMATEDWANGFGTKYTYNLRFDELVRCRDCEHCEPDVYLGLPAYRCEHFKTLMANDNGYCAWGERRA